MNKEQIVRALAKGTRLTQPQCNEAFDVIIEAMLKSLGKKQRVVIRGLGVFKVRPVKGRRVRADLHSDRYKQIPNHWRFKYSPGKELKGLP